ncbi:SUMO conjugating enzyme Hus5 [Friedmanniomyces endolithicus]|nr:SUMO conjugating enzyme Hus5 [Friedmanniomyces endolithicus]
MATLCTTRLTEERKNWRKDHPFGFVARPVKTAQGALDLKKWDCAIPGKDRTIWEGGLFKLEMHFPDELLVGIQMLLDEVNPDSPAQADAYGLFKKDRQAYDKKIRQVVKENPAP